MTDTTSPERTIDRRAALTTLAAAGALGAASGLTSADQHGGHGNAKSLLGVLGGYDPSKAEYVLPPLPYAHDALEPHIDEQTMRIHHGKHHAGYVRGLNRAVKALLDIREGRGESGMVGHWMRELAFHGGGHVNHTLFWATMAPPGEGGGGYPEGGLAERIRRDFGSFEQFVAQFKASAGSVKGSGWGWLVWEPLAGRLLTMQVESQQDLDMTGVVPLLGVDVWEHAYYLRYQNRRSDYISAFMNVVNWGRVGELYELAAG